MNFNVRILKVQTCNLNSILLSSGTSNEIIPESVATDYGESKETLLSPQQRGLQSPLKEKLAKRWPMG